jgi:sugar/nucleoside kinase (ribokinase family)
MNVLVIGKPAFNVIIPVDAFPVEGKKTIVNGKIEMAGGTSVYTACLLSKWGINVSYSGIVGGDEFGTLIKKDLDSYKVNTKFLEVNYEHKTAFNYKIINKTTGVATQLIDDNGIFVTKYKFDFVPDIVITDGTDMPGSIAALNNYPKAKSILLANKVNEEYYDLSKRCSYVIANMDFAKALTKMDFEFNHPKQLVNLFQKIKDLNKAEYILMLRENGVMYTSSRQVKMIPAIPVQKQDDSNSGSAFFAAICYGIINGYDMDISAKMANIAGGLSLTKLGTLSSIPELATVLKMAGIQEVTETSTPVNNVKSTGQVKKEEVTTNNAKNG